jgi:hypothetical protein
VFVRMLGGVWGGGRAVVDAVGGYGRVLVRGAREGVDLDGDAGGGAEDRDGRGGRGFGMVDGGVVGGEMYMKFEVMLSVSMLRKCFVDDREGRGGMRLGIGMRMNRVREGSTPDSGRGGSYTVELQSTPSLGGVRSTAANKDVIGGNRTVSPAPALVGCCGCCGCGAGRPGSSSVRRPIDCIELRLDILPV